MNTSPSTEGMTLADAIRIVDSHQTWRTWKHDEGGPPATHPRELTAALNILLSVCRGELRRQREARKPAPKPEDDSADWRPSQGRTLPPLSINVPMPPVQPPRIKPR